MYMCIYTYINVKCVFIGFMRISYFGEMFIYNVHKIFIHITDIYIYSYLKMLYLSFITQLCYLYTLDIISLSDTYFEKACLPLYKSFYFINDIIGNTPCC